MKNIDNEINSAEIEQGQDQTLLTSIAAINTHTDTTECAPGAVVGEAYEVVGLLGRGGMGNVYHVRHTIMQKEYALKTLNSEQVTEAAWRRFQNEAQAIARMSHPNVVAISNLGLHQGYLPYYVMDLLHGQTLLEILQKRRTLPINEALTIFIEACAGIGYAHKKGIVHRDIKPGNIVILDQPDSSSRLKIVDFGIAKLSATKDLHNQQLTNVGEICGSPLYMSPEQCHSGRIDARSDVYSLGCTLFETLTGTPPFKGQSAVETMMLHQSAKAPTLEAAAGGKQFPRMLESIVASMLAKTPMDRYQNMELLAQDLTAALANKDLPISPYGVSTTTHGQSTLSAVDPAKVKNATSRPGGSPETRPQRRLHVNRRALTAICAAGGLLLSCAAVWWYGQYHPAELKSIKDRMAWTEPKVADTIKESDANEDVFKALPDLSGEGSDLTSHVDSATDTRLFSQDRIKDGQVYRVFHFPTDIAFGLLRDDQNKDMNVFCVNKFEKPPDQNLIFVPDRLTARYPQYLKRFRAGDIYGVVFPTEIINDRNFAACATIPGVRKLRIENCPNLTVKSLPSLYKFDCLKDFRYRNGPFSVKDIIKMPRFNYLTTLYFDGKNASELLSAARQAGRLEKLDLLFSPLTEEDFDTISNMTPLQMLAIGGATITSPEVQKLAKLPRLKELYLNGCKISDDALPQFKQLKVLNKLGIQNCRLSAKKRHALEASLPQVLLK